MEYVTVKIMAEKWGITARRVQTFCSEGQIRGAKKIGHQWMIPENAERPRDGRYDRQKRYNEEEFYNYPMLMFTRFFNNAEDLSEDETLLLKAQIMDLQGDHQECIESCRHILKKSPAYHVAFGCYASICRASIPLGLNHEYMTSYKMAEICAGRATFHYEDYKLILAELKLYVDQDTEPILKIQSEKLSPDAKPHFYATLMFISVAGMAEESEMALLTYRGICEDTIGREMAPLAIQMCSLLAILYHKRANTDEDAYMVHIAVNLARRYNLWSFLAMFYSPNLRTMNSELDGDEKTLDYMNHIAECNAKNWHALNKARSGKNTR